MENDLPLAYEVTLRYEGPTGRKYGDGEGYRLDMGIYEVVYTGPKGLPELVAEVKKIRTELEKWKGGIRGLLVQTVDQRRQHRIEARRRNMQILAWPGPNCARTLATGPSVVALRAPLGRSLRRQYTQTPPLRPSRRTCRGGMLSNTAQLVLGHSSRPM